VPASQLPSTFANMATSQVLLKASKEDSQGSSMMRITVVIHTLGNYKWGYINFNVFGQMMDNGTGNFTFTLPNSADPLVGMTLPGAIFTGYSYSGSTVRTFYYELESEEDSKYNLILNFHCLTRPTSGSGRVSGVVPILQS